MADDVLMEVAIAKLAQDVEAAVLDPGLVDSHDVLVARDLSLEGLVWRLRQRVPVPAA